MIINNQEEFDFVWEQLDSGDFYTEEEKKEAEEALDNYIERTNNIMTERLNNENQGR